MRESSHDYWTRRADEEAQTALSAKSHVAEQAHRELARVYRERARQTRKQAGG